MAKGSTYTIGRAELRRALIAFGVSDKNAVSVFGAMDKAHKHMNVIAFVSLLEKAGLERERAANILRRIGMDDITINSVFNMADEQKIAAETGRLYKAVLEIK